MKKQGWMVFLANAAILLQYDGVKVLIDGLYRDNSGCFSQLPDALLEEMRNGTGEMADIDYLLFTHSHSDHFYASYAAQYLQKNRVKGYSLPCSPETFHGCRAISFDAEGRAALGQDIFCSCLEIRHLDPRFYGITNRCYLLGLGEKRILFLGDADYQKEGFAPLAGEAIDIAFATPVFFNHPLGRQILQEQLKVKKIVLYHLPFSWEDTMQTEKMARRDAARYAKEGQPVVIWNRTGQALVF